MTDPPAGAVNQAESSASAVANWFHVWPPGLRTLPFLPSHLGQAASAAASVAEPSAGFMFGALERLCDFFNFKAMAKVGLLLSDLKQFTATAFISHANTHRLFKLLLCVSRVYVFLYQFHLGN